MNYSAMPGQRVTQQPNPASPTNAGSSSSPAYNFMPTQGVGSNQYQSLPAWMNTGSFGNWLPGGGSGGPIINYMPSGSSAVGGGASSVSGGYAPITQQQLMNQAPSSAAYAATRQQLLSQIPGASAVTNPTTQQLLNDIQGTNIPVTNPQGQPWAMGSPQQELMAQGANLWQPLSSGASMNYMPTGGTRGIAGGTGGVFGGPTAYSSNYGLGVPQQGQSYGAPASSWTGAGGGPILGGGLFSVEQPVDPALQGSLAGYLTSQVGKGVSPFNLPTQLPFGGTTAPGQLTAMANPLLQNLMNYYQGGQSSTPGANALAGIANQGIDVLPAFKAMVNAMGQNTAQNQAQLQEQFAGMGGLAGTPFGNAMSNYQQGVANQQQSTLANMTLQGILQGQIPVAEGLLSGGQQFGQYAQGLNQQAITNMLTEQIRTSPQYNPTLGYQFGMGTSYDPVLSRAGQTQGSALDALLANLGPILTGAGNLNTSIQNS